MTDLCICMLKDCANLNFTCKQFYFTSCRIVLFRFYDIVFRHIGEFFRMLRDNLINTLSMFLNFPIFTLLDKFTNYAHICCIKQYNASSHLVGGFKQRMFLRLTYQNFLAVGIYSFDSMRRFHLYMLARRECIF